MISAKISGEETAHQSGDSGVCAAFINVWHVKVKEETRLHLKCFSEEKKDYFFVAYLYVRSEGQLRSFLRQDFQIGVVETLWMYKPQRFKCLKTWAFNRSQCFGFNSLSQVF